MSRRKGETVEDYNERKKAYSQTPNAKASRRAQAAMPGAKARKKAYQKAYHAKAKANRDASRLVAAASAVTPSFKRLDAYWARRDKASAACQGGGGR